MSDAPSNDQLLRTTLIGGILLTFVEPASGIICVTTSLAGLVSARAARREAQGEKARELAELRDQLRHREVLSVVEAKRARALRAVGIGGLPAVSSVGGALVLYWRWREKLKDLEREREGTAATGASYFFDRWRSEGEVAEDDEVPEDLLCAITEEPFRDPVICADGHTCERCAIEDWFGRGNRTSPMTNKRHCVCFLCLAWCLLCVFHVGRVVSHALRFCACEQQFCCFSYFSIFQYYLCYSGFVVECCGLNVRATLTVRCIYGNEINPVQPWMFVPLRRVARVARNFPVPSTLVE